MGIKPLKKVIAIGIFIFIILVISILPQKKEFRDIKIFDNLYEKMKKNDNKEEVFLTFATHGKNAGNYLINRLVDEKDSILKSDVIQIIGFTGCLNCEEKLVMFLTDPDWRVRFFTIDTLDRLEYKKISLHLPKIIIKDTNNNVRVCAIMSLGKYGNTKDMNFLKDISKRKDYDNEKITKAINIALTARTARAGPRYPN